MKSMTILRLLILLTCCVGCQSESVEPAQENLSFDQDAEDARAAQEALNNLFALAWDDARDAAARGDNNELQAAKMTIRKQADDGFVGLTSVVAGDGSAEEKGLAATWLGEFVADVSDHALQISAINALFDYRDSAREESARQSATTSLIACLSAAAESDPADSSVWNLLGEEKLNLQEYEDAIAAFDKALAIDPQLVNAYYLKGLAFRGQGDHAKAVELYTQALEIQPDYTDILIARAVGRKELQEFNGAIADLTAVLEQKPNLGPAYQLRGQLYQAVGKQEQADKDLQKVRALQRAEGN